MRGNDSSRFFEFGEITIQAHDPRQKEAALDVCMPACLMQAVTPQLLGAGFIDKYSVRSPLATWLPKITAERFLPDLVEAAPHIPIRVQEQMFQRAKSLLEMFVQLSKALIDPTDAVPLLPLGIYVTFQYRCRTDDLAKVLLGLETMPISGIAEFRFALASVLARLLQEEGAVAQLES
jgi:hypothetical protein